MWQPIKLSRRQIHAADRVGGIDLVLPWPDGLLGARVKPGDERDATAIEHAAAETIVGPSCRAADLVPVRSMVGTMERPPGLPRAQEVRQHLIVCIIGRRWVHAGGHPSPVLCWAAIDHIPLLPIANEADYGRSLAEIEGLMSAKRDTPQGDRLDALVRLIEDYEAE